MVILGGFLLVFSMFMLSLTSEGEYYRVFLAQAVGMGLGQAMLFLPSLIIIGHHFKRRRALATGIAVSVRDSPCLLLLLPFAHEYWRLNSFHERCYSTLEPVARAGCISWRDSMAHPPQSAQSTYHFPKCNQSNGSSHGWITPRCQFYHEDKASFSLGFFSIEAKFQSHPDGWPLHGIYRCVSVLISYSLSR